QLLCLESMDPDRDISIYINSPGGSFTALTAISQRTVGEAGWRCPTCALGSMKRKGRVVPAHPVRRR
ncbi:ATP-dependent Clp protease proteolytic subunit, partial [[Kitasatospora] papulosa]|uniref:ATP-dependent Clp protease proteolytic subunit n=1 Tax=[Kitasatospora] papulosa TaxID=1464011 RepID=UPI0036A890C5